MSTVGATGSSPEEAVVLAAFENRHAAERMLRSLGREFRRRARSGDALLWWSAVTPMVR